MLLAKSRESRNCVKSYYKTGYWVSPALLIFSPITIASPASITSPTSVASIFLSLLLVVGVIFLLAFLMRRFNVTTAGQGQLRVVASLMTGNREKVMVIQVGEDQHLIGVTTHHISHLGHLTTPLATSPTTTVKVPSFASALQSVLQGNAVTQKMRNDHEK